MKTLRIFVDFKASPDVLEMLREGTQPHQLVFPGKPAESVMHQAEPGPEFQTVDIAFGQPEPSAVESAAKLKWVHVSTSGITRYDNPHFRAEMGTRGIMVSNSASVYSEACATHVFSFMLANARCLPEALRSSPSNGTPDWQKIRSACVPLAGQTALIVGYGAIGRRLVEMLEPFHMRILGYRRSVGAQEKIPLVTLQEAERAMRSEADHIINILPDSTETRHFFDERRLSSVKPGTVFYNIGRGTTVDQQALLKALQSGRIASAWLDVTDPEPLPKDHPLRLQPNCHITPHTAGGHQEEAKTLVRHFLLNFQRYTRGEPLADRVM
jgi:phosphoglycerate dehydrogenase-like enzyme